MLSTKQSDIIGLALNYLLRRSYNITEISKVLGAETNCLKLHHALSILELQKYHKWLKFIESNTNKIPKDTSLLLHLNEHMDFLCDSVPNISEATVTPTQVSQIKKIRKGCDFITEGAFSWALELVGKQTEMLLYRKYQNKLTDSVNLFNKAQGEVIDLCSEMGIYFKGVTKNKANSIS